MITMTNMQISDDDNYDNENNSGITTTPSYIINKKGKGSPILKQSYGPALIPG